MAMAVRLSLTLFSFRSRSGCASVTFLRSARALFASAVILSCLGHLLLGIVVILLVERRSPRWESHASKSFSKHTHGIDRMSTAAAYSTKGALIVALHESRRITQFDVKC